jgi:hypothetical protein
MKNAAVHRENRHEVRIDNEGGRTCVEGGRWWRTPDRTRPFDQRRRQPVSEKPGFRVTDVCNYLGAGTAAGIQVRPGI